MFYNLYLLIKYNAYINVKIYINIETYKYNFKYVYKNNNRANFYIIRIKKIN